MTILRYIHIPPWHELRNPQVLAFWGRAYLFRNLPHIIPGRWGGGIYGFEIGSRNPGDPVGVLLKRIGLWPW